MAALALLVAAVPALGHDESVQFSMQLVIGPDKTDVELRFPIEAMIVNDANFAASQSGTFATAPAVVDMSKVNSQAVAEAHADQMAGGLHLWYDDVPLKPKILSIAIKNLVAGVSEEDVTPRPMGIYTIEYRPESPCPPPKVFTLGHKLLRQPDDGSIITVIGAVNYRPTYDTKGRFDAVDSEQEWTTNLNWPAGTATAAMANAATAAGGPTGGAPTASAPQASGSPSAPAGRAAPATPAATQPALGRGYLYIILAAVLAFVGLGVSLFKRRAPAGAAGDDRSESNE